MPGGSTKKTCPFCQSILFCAQKICAHCLKEQPKKQRLEKKLKRFDEKREDWVSGRKKNHNIASIKDEAIVLLEKLHAIGFKPDYLDKIGTFYEYLCEGWTQDSTGQGVAEDPDEERVTLNLTPCDPSEPTNNWQEAGTTESQVPETSTVQVEVLKAPPVKQRTTKEVGQEGGKQRARCRRKHRAGGGAEGPPLKQCTITEVGQEAGTTESQVPETSTVQVEVLKAPPREAAYHQRGGAGGRDHREPGAGDKHRAGGGAEGPPREAAYHQRGGAGGRDHREPGAGDKHCAGGGAEDPPREAVHHHRGGAGGAAPAG
ncbi:Voltage-dependent P/Q-type calcium channel subunit alpha-1A [Dissostichus eleginoides]|uniref:Voltage-dependent P/Q-type calcium channel subunit alpha-1A n=1 Tax=Dissostichus eleginoides TaxID=100907 RepID=A0AAD9FGD7_DISEL|nr:Voltage-dependent P/Q-type calcium channel subunit alpha-1A [Dissostichus eleginoides]